MTLHLSFPSMYKSRYKNSFENKVMGLVHRSLVSLCHSFFSFSLLFSLCSSFRMTPWNTGALLVFCVNQRRSSLFLSPFTSLITYAIILRVPLDPAGAGPQKRIPWKRAWLPTPVFLPGEFHGQRSLVGYRPWGHKEMLAI